ncbi:helix-hairpin-helix domain-containing protein [Lactococcus sp.]|uniref:helix-hairpin-helix domain-containing protein n=1 Tax=Lactococcus sp. TaxID=44273 RepID=UPI0035B2CBF2
MEKLIQWLQSHQKMLVISAVAFIAVGIFYFVSSDKPATTLSVDDLSAVSTDRSSKLDKTQSSQEKSASTRIKVDLKGAVKAPKVYELSSESRVNDLIQMAGGFMSDADQNSVNLASKLKDEAVIYVASKGENQSVLTNSSGQSQAATASNLESNQKEKVNINTADATTLQTLSGIGSKKAQDIIDYRTQNGNFKTVDELGKVSGFGSKTLEKLKDLITIDG